MNLSQPRLKVAPLSLTLEFTRLDEPQDAYMFRFEPQGYTLRTAGGGRERFDVEWSREILEDIEALRQPGGGLARAERLSRTMQRALAPIGWDDVGEQIRRASEAGRRVLVTVRSNAAELYTLPWELLLIGASGQHLGELPGVLLRHEWPATTTMPETASPRPEGGRVLLAWSAAGGVVPAAEHMRAISAAWSEGHVRFDPQRDVLTHASAAGIADALARSDSEGQPFAVLHLLCHGGRAGSTYGLVLDGADGAPSVVDAGRLRHLLGRHAGSLRLVVLAACDGGNSGDPGNHLGSVAQTLHRAGIQSVIASRYPLSLAASTVVAETLYHSLLVEVRPLEQAFLDVRTRLIRNPAHIDWASIQMYAREADGDDTRPVVFRPFRGLLAFQAEHRRFFFGRDAEVSEVTTRLAALERAGKPRFVVVAGASGTGKSSVVLAGAVPQLALAGARVVRTRPGNDWHEAWAGVAAQAGGDGRIVLVVDQFEELFAHEDDGAWRSAYARQLWAIAQDPASRTSVILTIRVDFLGRCSELVLDESGTRLDRVAYDDAHRVLVASMTQKQMEAVVEAPAAKLGLELEAGLMARMLTEVESEPGALPLLEDTLDLLWQARHGRSLTQAAYTSEGGVTGALVRRSDALIDGLEVGDQALARRLLVSLVAVVGDVGVLATRRRVAIAAQRPTHPEEAKCFDRVLEQLVQARLLVQNEGKTGPMVEVAHETLIRKWDRLRVWVAEDQAKLQHVSEVKAWVDRCHRHGTLLAGRELLLAEEAARTFPAGMGRSADDVRAAAAALIRRSRARRRWMRAGVALAATALTLAGIVGYDRLRISRIEAACAAEGDAVREFWDPAVRSRVESGLLATGTSYAEKVAESVLSDLDGQADAWRTAATEVCLNVERRDRWTPETRAKAQLCLADRRLELSALIDEFIAADAQTAEKAVQAVASLRRIEPCLSEQSLARLPSPPPELQGDILAIQHELSQAWSAEVAGHYEKGLAIARSALAAAQRTAWRPLVAAANLRLAELLHQVGKYKEATEVMQTSFKLAREVGADEISTLAAVRLVDLVGLRLGRPIEGELWSSEVAIGLFMADQRDPLAGKYLHNLGLVRNVAGDLKTSRLRFEQALVIREAVLGPEHPDTLTTLGNLAQVIGSLGEHEASRERLEHILTVQTRLLGPEHSYTLATRENLASAYYNAGNFDEARRGYAATLADQERILGAEHPDTLGTLSNLAAVAERFGELDTAYQYNQRALTTLRRVLGPEHPQTLQTHSNLAYTLLQQGKRTEAASHFAEVLGAQDRVLGPEHPETLRTRLNYASCLRQTGDLAAARENLARVIQTATHTLGPDHPLVLSARSTLAAIMTDEGDLKSASQQERELIDAKRRALGPEHPSTLLSMSNYALSLTQLGQYDDAEQLFKQCLTAYEKLYGPEHQMSVGNRIGLAEVGYRKKDFPSALAHVQRAINLINGREDLTMALAEAKYLLAQILWDIPDGPARDRPRARNLAREAAEAFRTDKWYEPEMKKAEAWLREHPAGK